MVSLDQVGFIPGREAWDNMLKAFLIHHWLKETNTPGFFLSWMRKRCSTGWPGTICLRLLHLGIGEQFGSKLKLLYSDPWARVQVNGQLLDAFMIRNGTRQGCPLSPLLYVLSLEPILRCIHVNAAIKGIPVQDRTYKTSAFADDILLVLTDPLPHYSTYFHSCQISRDYRT